MSDSEEEAKLAEVKAVLRRLQRIAAAGDRAGVDVRPDAAARTKAAGLAGGESANVPSIAMPPGAGTGARALNEILQPSETLLAKSNRDETFVQQQSAVPQNSSPPAGTTGAVGAGKREGVFKVLVVSGLLLSGAAAIAIYYRQQLPELTSTAIDASPSDTKGTVGVSADPKVGSPQNGRPAGASGPGPAMGPKPAAQAPGGELSTRDVLGSARADLEAGRVHAARTTLLAKAAAGSPEVALLLGRTYDPTVLRQLPQADAQPNSAEAAKWYRAWHERATSQGQASPASALERLLRSLE
jgi:hypothetical protein